MRREHLKAAEAKAVEDQERAKKRFREWVRTKVPDAEYMNICSGPQVRLVAPCAGQHAMLSQGVVLPLDMLSFEVACFVRHPGRQPVMLD